MSDHDLRQLLDDLYKACPDPDDFNGFNDAILPLGIRIYRRALNAARDALVQSRRGNTVPYLKPPPPMPSVRHTCAVCGMSNGRCGVLCGNR